MFSIAICDDDVVFGEQCKVWISDDLKAIGVEYQVLVYNSIRNITYDIMDGLSFDALFLDIEFPKERDDGVEYGMYLRGLLQNECLQIVFISSKDSYAMRLFEIHPIEFLIKPIEPKRLHDTVERIVHLRGINTKTFTYTFGTREHHLQLSRIMYFESVGRKVKIFCRDKNVYIYNGKIADVYEALKEEDFFSPHKSFVVNYHAVKQWSRTELILVDGSTVPVSRNRAAEIRRIQTNRILLQ